MPGFLCDPDDHQSDVLVLISLVVACFLLCVVATCRIRDRWRNRGFTPSQVARSAYAPRSSSQRSSMHRRVSSFLTQNLLTPEPNEDISEFNRSSPRRILLGGEQVGEHHWTIDLIVSNLELP
jgi:hypothetical protein